MKPVARGSVLVHLPIAEVDRDFARDVGEQSSGTTIERLAECRYRTVSRAGWAWVIGDFDLERVEADETVVHATLWVRPRFFGFLARRLLGRRRMQRGVDAALVRMARSATGDTDPAEFGPEDFACEAAPPDFRKDTPRD
jgi:hypothetical protein